MYIKNSVGPRTEPCGTPEVTSNSKKIVFRHSSHYLITFQLNRFTLFTHSTAIALT